MGAPESLRDATARKRWLVQFDKPVESGLLMRIRNRDIRILGAVPDNALLVSAPVSEQFAELGVRWRGVLEAGDKLSAAAIESAAGQRSYFVFEFYEDADVHQSRQLLVGAGVDLKEHPDLRPWQLLGIATRETAMQVAADESLLYIFPASQELIDGQPLRACGGAVREDGVVAAIAAGVGDGWDGPGKGSAALTYSFGPLTAKLPEAAIRGEVLRAFAEWRKYAKVTFTETQRRTGERNIDVLFGSGSHGDPYPFDGKGGVLAHTFYPAPPNSEPIAGDLHLDGDEPWEGAMDLFSVVLHELGHALGLGHSGEPASVMYPFYRKVTQLAKDDINSIQQIYAAQESGSTDGGGGGVAPPEALAITVDAVPAPVTSATAALSGKAAGGRDPVSITWTTDAGALGAGRGARDWTIAAVPLNLGANRVNITATDGDGSRATRSVTIERRAESTPPAAPPEIQFVEPPASVTVTTASIRVRGTASQSSGIESVSWRNAKTGSGGLAAGTGFWDLAMVALQSGANVITADVKARDGSTASKSITVTLASPAATPAPPPSPTPSPVPATPSPSPSADTAAPSLAIGSPATVSSTASAAQISVSGTARDNVGVTSITWSTASGSGTAAGTSNWSANIPLLVGINNIVIRAYDAAGNSSWRAVSVTRR